MILATAPSRRNPPLGACVLVASPIAQAPSCTAWEYATTHDDWNDEGFSITGYGGEETPSARALVRAYPRAVAGRVAAFAYDAATRSGALQCEAEVGTTEIVVPARLYPEGVDASLEGTSGRAEWGAAHGLLLVETSAPGTATVHFAPAE